MPQMSEEEAEARSIGLALLDASSIYEDYVIPTFEGNLRRRPFPPHRRAIIGLVGRQRRFLRAVHTLADAGQLLEAIGPLRSMLEFLVVQRWLAQDPDRNWKLWMADDHAARDLWRKRVREHMPALHDAAVASLTAEQRAEGEQVTAVHTQLAAELGSQWPGDRRQRKLEQRAAQVGLSVLYDVLYRYESNAAPHPSMLAVDLLLEKHRKGLILRGEPTAQFAAVPVYLHSAILLHEALKDSGELTDALHLSGLPPLGRQIHALVEKRASTQVPNWRDLLPDGATD
jgi:hypothetical protein